MTTEQRALCWGLVITPTPESGKISKEEFLCRFPSAVEDGKMAVKWLETACTEQHPEDLTCALIVGFRFGFGPEHIDILCSLVDEKWHYSHEDVVRALDRMRTPKAIEALFRATQWIPEYLEYNDTRALATKAIWGLGWIPGPEAKAKLEMLAHSDDKILRACAKERLRDRNKRAIDT